MTVSSTNNVAGPFDGNDVAIVFPFTFPVQDAADIRVVLTDSSGVESDIVAGTGYTLSLNADQNASAGGSVSYPASGSPLATGDKLTVIREVSAAQLIDLQNQGAWQPEVIEDALDKLTMAIQQNAEAIARAVKVSLTSGTDPDALISSITAAVSAASISAAAAASAQAAAELVLDTFDDRYLGEKSSAPTVDNDGNALQAGAEYFDSTGGARLTWTGSAWIAGGSSTASGVVNVPSGSISSADVQSAINELDSEKEAADVTILKDADVGIGANKLVQQDAAGKLPAIDGSQLTGIDIPNATTSVAGLMSAADKVALNAAAPYSLPSSYKAVDTYANSSLQSFTKTIGSTYSGSSLGLSSGTWRVMGLAEYIDDGFGGGTYRYLAIRIS